MKIQTNDKVKKEKMLHVEADATLPYAVVVTAMAVAKDAGVAKVLLLTDPAKNLNIADLEREADAP
jgi:biopolymer transport protein ExbD